MKTPLLLLSLLLNISLIGQTTPSIKTIKLFTEGAEITRAQTLKINKGIDTLILENLSPFVANQTIQAKIKGAKILDVDYTINHLKPKKDQPKLAKIKSQIKSINKDLLNLNDELTYLEIEKDLILSNKQIRGEDPLDIDDVKDFVEYYQNKLPDLLSKITDTEQQIKKFKQVHRKLLDQERELEKVKTKKTGEIQILYQSDKTQNGSLEVSYHVYGCGWKPLYTMRATNIDEPIQFEYHAMTYQNTGVNWNNCALTIASGNPILNGDQPQLFPWRLKIQTAFGNEYLMNSSLYRNDDGVYEEERLSRNKLNFKQREVVQTQNLTFTSFEIPQKFSLTTGGGEKRVKMLINNLPATFHYYAVPKKSNSVYLVADVTDWEKMPLIPGQSHIYFDGTFVGKSFINPKTMEDTLTISLGQDQSILTERIKQEDKCVNNVSILGVSKKRAYDVSIKNNRNKPIQIEIIDQIPISKNNKIKVTHKLGDGWVLKEETGILEWNINIPAGEKASTSLEFEVKHPKKYNVPL